MKRIIKAIFQKIIYAVLLLVLIIAFKDYTNGGKLISRIENKVISIWNGGKTNVSTEKDSTNEKATPSENIIFIPQKTTSIKGLKSSLEEDIYTSEFWYSATPEQVQNKIQSGMNVNERNKSGVSLFMFASAVTQNPDVIALMIENGADLQTRDEEGRDALMWASSFSNTPEVIKQMIKHGANPHKQDKRGRTALIYAAAKNANPKISEVLLLFGSDVNIQVQDKNNSLHKASIPNKVVAASKIAIESVAELFDRVYNNLSDTTELKQTSMLNALEEAIESLSNKIINPEDGMTPLIFASRSSTSQDVLKILLDYGADVRLYDSKGLTAIDYGKQNPQINNTEIFWKMNDLLYAN